MDHFHQMKLYNTKNSLLISLQKWSVFSIFYFGRNDQLLNGQIWIPMGICIPVD